MSHIVLRYYGLAVQPFGVTPDPDFLFLSHTHREAMASLVHGILSARGFSALIASPGMGKTTLLFNLMHMLKGVATTAFLFQTLCAPKEFLRAFLADLGIEDSGRDFTRMHAKLNDHLLKEARRHRHVILIIDEAQNLDERVLEVVRMLSNFETPQQKLMHVVLAGQPQLEEKVSHPNLTQLRQRISLIARLRAFDAAETRAYIDHRLKLAGFSGDESLFTNEACATIAEYSRGIPRNINNICFNAMSLGCALERDRLDPAIVQEVVRDLTWTNSTTAMPETTHAKEIQPMASHPAKPATPSASRSRLRAVALTVLSVIGVCSPLAVDQSPQMKPAIVKQTAPPSSGLEQL